MPPPPGRSGGGRRRSATAPRRERAPALAAPTTRTGRAIPTRWKDNDVYGHVNNVEYYSFFDTVINAWLIEEGGLDIHGGAVIGLCAESHCTFHAPLAFPETVEAALRVGAPRALERALRDRAVRRAGRDGPAATGWFVHVFVDRATRRAVEIPPRLRAALERLVVAG